MFEREARWMLLRFAIMALAAFVLAIVVPPFLGRMTPERCDAEGGIWDAHNGECQRERMGPRALDLERIPDRPPKNPRRLSGMIAIGGGSVIRSRNPENYGNSVRTELAEPPRRLGNLLAPPVATRAPPPAATARRGRPRPRTP